MLKLIDRTFSTLAGGTTLGVALLLVAAIGYLDYLSGAELSASIFYVLPIALTAWYINRRFGMVTACTAAITWLVADWAAAPVYSAAWIPYWNSLVRLTLFLLIAWLVARVRQQLREEEALADTDLLTGLPNRRAFFELFELELTRVRRYREPFTLAYVDLDNFKTVNDTMGHDMGDEVLKSVARELREHTRESDCPARLGGDEFAVLFPMADWSGAENILKKLHQELSESMERDEWPITFSIGALTFGHAAGSTRDMIRAVDNLMYTVKKEGKNRLLHKKWEGSVEP